MLEKIKELLGEELTGQVEAALKGKGKDGRDIDLVIGNDGSYVPAEKLETERQARTSAETALKNAAAALKGVGGLVIIPAGSDIPVEQRKEGFLYFKVSEER